MVYTSTEDSQCIVLRLTMSSLKSGVQATAALKGYPPSILEPDKTDQKFICRECGGILRDPIQTYCGHRYCRYCFQQLTKNSCRTDGIRKAVCKPCLEEGVKDSMLRDDEVYSDRAILRELHLLQVTCFNSACRWTGLYKEYDNDHYINCPFGVIDCPDRRCRSTFQRRYLMKHLEEECQMRTVQCHFCQSNLVYNDLKDHHTVCPYYPIACPFCQRKDISREKLSEHQDLEIGDCTRKMVNCGFRDIGCQEMVELHKEAEHNKKSVDNHMGLMCEAVVSLRESIQRTGDGDNDVTSLKESVNRQEKSLQDLEAKTDNLKTQCERVNSDCRTRELPNDAEKRMAELHKAQDSILKQLQTLHTKVSTYEGIVAVLSNLIDQAKETLKRSESQGKKDREFLQSLERKIIAQDRIIALKDVALAEQDLRIQSLEMASYDGVLVWKITNFARKRSDAQSGKGTSLYSPCFYTSCHGYKMCARVYLNGDGMGKGNHVSLFFTIMKGPFDALLRWPFRQKVTLMWLDQNNREHVIDAFRPDPTSSSFKQPVQDMNIASGCPLFMPLSQLDSPRHKYVKDDIAFLKVIVDTSDIT
ncbi:TNF receptor-associated factor 2-like [Ptychodera flava]|uniref:TNF receptor-associated factor 2-like n=1 Tax=Ptychodera flava TaxID=63121 RepID=UPI00396A5C40